jgi:hypothetical protein
MKEPIRHNAGARNRRKALHNAKCLHETLRFIFPEDEKLLQTTEALVRELDRITRHFGSRHKAFHLAEFLLEELEVRHGEEMRRNVNFEYAIHRAFRIENRVRAEVTARA